MAARTVYACIRCQPLLEGTQLAASRTQALGKASPHKVVAPNRSFELLLYLLKAWGCRAAVRTGF